MPSPKRQPWLPVGGERERDEALAHLRERGFHLTGSWNWLPPPGRAPDAVDNAAIHYLAATWGYGGLVRVRRCPFCGGEADPLAPGGPACRECDATAPTIAAWQRRVG